MSDGSSSDSQNETSASRIRPHQKNKKKRKRSNKNVKKWNSKECERLLKIARLKKYVENSKYANRTWEEICRKNFANKDVDAVKAKAEELLKV